MGFNKYNACKTKIDNITFDSRAEAKRYCELKLLEKAGEIAELELQPKFLLLDGFVYNGEKQRAVYYIADFKYLDRANGHTVIEDVKGVKTEVYKIKKKFFLCQYGAEYEFKEI